MIVTGELRYSASALRFNLSRAVAIDMESATVQRGYRFRVPGTLLCVLTNLYTVKLNCPGRQTGFMGLFQEHLQIGIRALLIYYAQGDRLHSRKLRTFNNEPPFR